jgi:hypothetical protein
MSYFMLKTICVVNIVRKLSHLIALDGAFRLLFSWFLRYFRYGTYWADRASAL